MNKDSPTKTGHGSFEKSNEKPAAIFDSSQKRTPKKDRRRHTQPEYFTETF